MYNVTPCLSCNDIPTTSGVKPPRNHFLWSWRVGRSKKLFLELKFLGDRGKLLRGLDTIKSHFSIVELHASANNMAIIGFFKGKKCRVLVPMGHFQMALLTGRRLLSFSISFVGLGHSSSDPLALKENTGIVTHNHGVTVHLVSSLRWNNRYTSRSYRRLS